MLVRFQNVITKPKSTGGTYVSGTFVSDDGMVQAYVCWDSELFTGIDAGSFATVTGEPSEYPKGSGRYQWVFKGVVPAGNLSREELLSFIPTSLSVTTLESRLQRAIENSSASEKAQKLIKAVFNVKDAEGVSLKDYFNVEFAAISHHDNRKSGLLHHTVKCLELLNTLILQHPDVVAQQETVDLLVIGVVLHDIGKIFEYDLGAASDVQFLGHRVLGSELLYKMRKFFVDLYSEEFFNHLIAIVMQHHGQYEERPRTVYSAIIHYVDNLEAVMTGIDDVWNSATGAMSVPLGGEFARVVRASWDVIES